MMYLQKAFTVLARPEKITPCEACVYGRGPHSEWCPALRGKLPCQNLPWYEGEDNEHREHPPDGS
jgi:hypothetical protein